MYSPEANYSMNSVQNEQCGAVREYQLNPEQYQESTQQHEAAAGQYQQQFDQYQTNKQNEGSQQHQQSEQVYNCYKDNQYQATVEPSSEIQQYKNSQRDYQGSQDQYQQPHQCSQDQYRPEYQGSLGQYQPSNQGSLDQCQQSNQGSVDHSLENQCNTGKNSSKFIVLLHGLPYSTNHEEIMKFLSGKLFLYTGSVYFLGLSSKCRDLYCNSLFTDYIIKRDFQKP